MTDITELALLVSKAKASVFTLEYISQFEPADIDSDDVDLRFEVDGRDNGTNVSIVDECGQAAKVIGALVVALEKAKGMEAYWKTQCRGITDHCEVLQARIAELEPRTVKLPAERFCPAEYAGSQLWSETEVWNKAITACADALRADGIKVEVE
ncbi:ead/Ea22-like family protein [Klebsiella variicola]|uniref:ead/Ea22-like family protein n=1 Tax=Klebsiella variicola TaxID=244366 RepID=UPI00388E6A88